MTLRQSLNKFLVKHPYIYGKIGLPRQKYDIFDDKYEICDGKYSVEKVDRTNRETVKRFMLGKLIENCEFKLSLFL